MPAPECLVSIVMPCLNEAETIATCVRSACQALVASGISGEVLVADNGSTDGSQALATEAGAIVVPVPERGYGAALMGGIAAARGRYVVMGDADDSYDFGAVPAFVDALERGNDLVMGSRFAGRIESGAMPFLHRWLGNPVLTGLGRLLFRSPISDFHCGIRAFRRDAVERMGLRTTGMEFASEMVVKSTLFGLKIAEIPVTLRRDGRSRPPHLRTWRDGWRHLRFLLLYSPRWLFLVPGFLLIGLGTALILWLLPGPQIVRGVRFDVHTLLGAAAMVLVGTQAIAFGIFAKIFAITEGLLPLDRRLEKAFRFVTLEVGLVAGALLGAIGLGLVMHVIGKWAQTSYGDLSYGITMRWMIPGVLLLVLSAQAILSSFFLSILGLKRR
ncbi:MAG: glycosyltransferase family 2 protein [Thermoanaerobaculia bacterium]